MVPGGREPGGRGCGAGGDGLNRAATLQQEDDAPDGRDARDAPVRRCIATRAEKPARELVRFVVGPDGTVVPDVAGRLPGRGMWVSATPEAIERASRGGFAKAAKAGVKVPADLVASVQALLLRRALDTLGLAKRSGDAVTGFDRVAVALATGRVAVLVQAADASALGRDKLSAKARALGTVEEAEGLTRAELGLAFGQENVVHAAVAPGGLARRLLDDMTRLYGFRPRRAAGDGGLDTE